MVEQKCPIVSTSAAFCTCNENVTTYVIISSSLGVHLFMFNILPLYHPIFFFANLYLSFLLDTYHISFFKFCSFPNMKFSPHQNLFIFLYFGCDFKLSFHIFPTSILFPFFMVLLCTC